VTATDDASRDVLDAFDVVGADETSDGGVPSFRVVVGPNDRGMSLLAAIRGARHSVHMSMYLLSSRDVLAELMRARTRGVDVQVMLNRATPRDHYANAVAYEVLGAAGVTVRWAPNTVAFSHAKYVIIDEAVVWIMTMNATAAGLTTNREFLAVDRNADDVRDVERLFRADFEGLSPTRYEGRLLVSPFNTRSSILSLIENASRSIDIECEVFDDRTVAAALVARARAGVVVRIVMPDAPGISPSERALGDALAGGVRVVRVRSPYVHAKAIVVDGARAYVGSANLSTASLTMNRELGLVFDVPAEVTHVAEVIAADFAAGRRLQ
jgi:phosphatidylserine/phosphatidylglycerophosphate/cardiolipin synthase-like enzyme